MGADRTRALRGALAGAVAAGAWAAQQPLDKKVFGVDYDDADLLGTLVTRRSGTPQSLAAGTALHLFNGAAFGAVYATVVAPNLPGPAVARGVAAGLVEHVGTWPLTGLVAAHPAGRQLPRLWGNRAAFAQATWRHLLFGALLGVLERRLNPPVSEPPPAPEHASRNGHRDIDELAVARPA